MPDPNPRAAEAMARAIYDACRPLQEPRWDSVSEAWHERRKADTQARAALTALCAMHPGVREVIEGSAVVVPVEPTPEMHTAGAMTIIRRNQSRSLVIYAAMLAASPYAPAATEGG